MEWIEHGTQDNQKVPPDTLKKLLKLGAKGETFDQIIQRLIKKHEDREGQKRT
jgi:hypothetical protein